MDIHVPTTRISFKDKNGNIAGTVGIGGDITLRKKAEEVVREHGGNLSVKSETGKVAKFPFDVPASDESGNQFIFELNK